MVEPAPTPPLVVAQPHLLLELLEIPFDAPAQLGLLDQVSKRRVRRQGREPVFRRLLLPLRPLDQDPFLSSGLMQQVIAVGRSEPLRVFRRLLILRGWSHDKANPTLFA
jgi:hypothetical protein